jgi:hypothetical protein
MTPAVLPLVQAQRGGGLRAGMVRLLGQIKKRRNAQQRRTHTQCVQDRFANGLCQPVDFIFIFLRIVNLHARQVLMRQKQLLRDVLCGFKGKIGIPFKRRLPKGAAAQQQNDKRPPLRTKPKELLMIGNLLLAELSVIQAGQICGLQLKGLFGQNKFQLLVSSLIRNQLLLDWANSSLWPAAFSGACKCRKEAMDAMGR